MSWFWVYLDLHVDLPPRWLICNHVMFIWRLHRGIAKCEPLLELYWCISADYFVNFGSSGMEFVLWGFWIGGLVKSLIGFLWLRIEKVTLIKFLALMRKTTGICTTVKFKITIILIESCNIWIIWNIMNFIMNARSFRTLIDFIHFPMWTYRCHLKVPWYSRHHCLHHILHWITGSWNLALGGAMIITCVLVGTEWHFSSRYVTLENHALP